jgi:hypothetical protein
MKIMDVPDPRIPPSLQNMLYEGSEFLPESKKIVDELIAETRANMELPFDELYH